MIRIFVALDLSQAAKRELGKFIAGLRSKRWPVKWEPAAKLHLTLFFIGWTKETKLKLIEKAVRKGVTGIDKFLVRIGKLGVFPDYLQPRVIWLGIGGNQQRLIKLQKQIEKSMVAAGFKAEKRAWTAHLTIGRVDKKVKYRARREIGRQLKKLQIEVIVFFSFLFFIHKNIFYFSK